MCVQSDLQGNLQSGAAGGDANDGTTGTGSSPLTLRGTDKDDGSGAQGGSGGSASDVTLNRKLGFGGSART